MAQNIAAMRAMRSRGDSYEAIGRALGCSGKTVSRLLGERPDRIRSIGQSSRGQRKRLVARDAEIVRLRHKGVPVAEVAKQYGITTTRVSQITSRTYRNRDQWKCQVCDERRPHGHCVVCGYQVERGDLLDSLCEREAQRALLIAIGRPKEADKLRTIEGEHRLASILDPFDEEEAM